MRTTSGRALDELPQLAAAEIRVGADDDGRADRPLLLGPLARDLGLLLLREVVIRLDERDHPAVLVLHELDDLLVVVARRDELGVARLVGVEDLPLRVDEGLDEGIVLAL